MKIYVAGPYSASSEEEIQNNVNRATDAGLILWKKGHHPYIPHLTHYVDIRAKENNLPMTWKEYIEWDRVWLEACDALLFLGGSNGAKLELDYAKSLGKIIYYDIEDVPTESKHKERLIIHA